MLGSTDTQATLQIIVQIADCNAGDGSGSCVYTAVIVISDCIAIQCNRDIPGFLRG